LKKWKIKGTRPMNKAPNLPSPKNCINLIRWTNYAPILLIIIFTVEQFIFLFSKYTRIDGYLWTPAFWAVAIHLVSSRLSGRSEWINFFFFKSFELGDVRLLFSGCAPQKEISVPVKPSHFPNRVVFWSQFETRDDDQAIWVNNALDYFGYKWVEVNADLVRNITYTSELILKDYIMYYKWFIGLAMIVGVIMAITDPIQEVLLCLILLSFGPYSRRENKHNHVLERFLPYHFHTWEFQEEITTSKSETMNGVKERWQCKVCGSERFMPDDAVSYIEF
jgi:hypothetical protein